MIRNGVRIKLSIVELLCRWHACNCELTRQYGDQGHGPEAPADRLLQTQLYLLEGKVRAMRGQIIDSH